jgi:hypothetical protein
LFASTELALSLSNLTGLIASATIRVNGLELNLLLRELLAEALIT